MIAATRTAAETDWLLLALVVVSALVLVLVFGLMLYFGWRFRAGNPMRRRPLPTRTFGLEVGWTAATMLAFFVLDVWAADLYLRQMHAPEGAMKIAVTAKQWMWKAEQPNGVREINLVHLPVDRDIEIVMTSEDVIHDFSVPAFRIKRDVLPGRYTMIWFHTTRTGRFRLYCDQYCGLDHALMVGHVIVMPAAAYRDWLDHPGGDAPSPAEGAAP
ncbi:cytochrome c oxidase subunit II [Nguyenibacter sp. L1]|uniref:cytochrome c oxidase subunit II n=1 Tax=Nguyenibacter sp. L1 TaxID=3049350 RepID=UPI002B49F114|nr:cytochrome c oxidase subunit II [Nguyenibacter sp. L1]WRH88902.1 cytochrome c oxidase subunit II [Nguyenibacter sp. L1]